MGAWVNGQHPHPFCSPFSPGSAPPPPAGLCVDGLYRVSGNLAVIQKLRYAVDRGQFPFPGRSLNSRLLVLTDALVSR